jgi:hypothetical protein
VVERDAGVDLSVTITVFVLSLTLMLPRSESRGLSAAWISAALANEIRYARVTTGSMASRSFSAAMSSTLMMPYASSTATSPRASRIVRSATSQGWLLMSAVTVPVTRSPGTIDLPE